MRSRKPARSWKSAWGCVVLCVMCRVCLCDAFPCAFASPQRRRASRVSPARLPPPSFVRDGLFAPLARLSFPLAWHPFCVDRGAGGGPFLCPANPSEGGQGRWFPPCASGAFPFFPSFLPSPPPGSLKERIARRKSSGFGLVFFDRRAELPGSVLCPAIGRRKEQAKVTRRKPGKAKDCRRRLG